MSVASIDRDGRQYTHVANCDEIPAGSNRLFATAGRELLVCHADGQFYAIHPQCPHQEASLSGGRVRGKAISCPMHGYRFNLETGKVFGSVPCKPLVKFDLIVDEGQIFVATD